MSMQLQTIDQSYFVISHVKGPQIFSTNRDSVELGSHQDLERHLKVKL